MFCLFKLNKKFFQLTVTNFCIFSKVGPIVTKLACLSECWQWCIRHIFGLFSNINSNNVGGSRHGDVWGQDGLETKSGTQHYQFTSA